MYIGEYLKTREGEAWTPQDTAEVLRIFGLADKTAQRLSDQYREELAQLHRELEEVKYRK